MKSLIIVLSVFFTLLNASTVVKDSAPRKQVQELRRRISERNFSFEIPQFTKVRSVEIIKGSRDTLAVTFNKAFSFQSFNNKNVDLIKKEIGSIFNSGRKKYLVKVYTLGHTIQELIPNFFKTKKDKNRINLDFKRPKPIIQKVDELYVPFKGFDEKNIVLWHSHGWYYDHHEKRWEWQRPRLFQTVEDLASTAFTIPFLIPMLENAGATVFVPRERDFQTNEIILDNDVKNSGYSETGIWEINNESGYLYENKFYQIYENPFSKGTSAYTYSKDKETATVTWLPFFTEAGYYSVYITYEASAENVDDASYTVYHSGGKTEYKINQQIGGNKWLYLGKFKFKEGQNKSIGSVVLSNKSKNILRKVSADAVRFGGGYSQVVKDGSVSEKPKFFEASKYYLQMMGVTDSLVYNINEDTSDYVDDYQSRPEFVNYLMGYPNGPTADSSKGLGIPVDLSIAIHTDAGISDSDTTIGTMAIYSYRDKDDSLYFPNGISRLTNRDYADLVQTQVVETIRKKYDRIWNRRFLFDSKYSEAFRPNIPSMILEVLAHQNFKDMKFFHDPRFRFDVARSIYIGMLKFLAEHYQFEYSVQPLPVTHFKAEFYKGNNVLLTWKPQYDFIEKSSAPEAYIVYTKINDGGFDNGILVYNNKHLVEEINENDIYSFKVVAVNRGGKSFPSEILSASFVEDSSPILVINGFNRVAGPQIIDETNFKGFLASQDFGVPYLYDTHFTGEQYNFNPYSKFLHNDSPGHGASKSNFENQIIAGNSFDYPFIHGQAINDCGYSFVSMSDEAVMDDPVFLDKYKMIDLIYGEEKETHWPSSYADSLLKTQYKILPNKLKSKLDRYLKKGGNLFISGAYIASDIFINDSLNSRKHKSVEQKFKYKFASNYASSNGKVIYSDPDFNFGIDPIEFCTFHNDSIYAVEAPDGLLPTGDSKTILRYSENNISAGIAHKGKYGIVAFGFPFETILAREHRKLLMQKVIDYFRIDE